MEWPDCLVFCVQAALLLMAAPISHAQNYNCYSCNSITDVNCDVQNFTSNEYSKITCGYPGCSTFSYYNIYTGTYDKVVRGCASPDEYNSKYNTTCGYDVSDTKLACGCNITCNQDYCNGQPAPNVTCYSCLNCDTVNSSTLTVSCPYSCFSMIVISGRGFVTSTERGCGPGAGVSGELFLLLLGIGYKDCATHFCNAEFPTLPSYFPKIVSPTTTETPPYLSTRHSSATSFRINCGLISAYILLILLFSVLL